MTATQTVKVEFDDQVVERRWSSSTTGSRARARGYCQTPLRG